MPLPAGSQPAKPAARVFWYWVRRWAKSGGMTGTSSVMIAGGLSRSVSAAGSGATQNTAKRISREQTAPGRVACHARFETLRKQVCFRLEILDAIKPAPVVVAGRGTKAP